MLYHFLEMVRRPDPPLGKTFPNDAINCHHGINKHVLCGDSQTKILFHFSWELRRNRSIITNTGSDWLRELRQADPLLGKAAVERAVISVVHHYTDIWAVDCYIH